MDGVKGARGADNSHLNGANDDAKKNLQGILFTLGNPLLDVSAEVDESFLVKYKLKPNDAILATDDHLNLCQDMIDCGYKIDYVPGGATQNSARVAQWLIGIEGAAIYMGCIGRDKYGEIMEKMMKDIGVNVVYKYLDTESTGTCAVCVTGTNRSLVAYLGAANHFAKDHLEVQENRGLMEKAQFYYMAGYPLTVCPDVMLDVARFASAHNRTFALNLSAPFLCSFFKEPMLKLLPYVDILFGNETEAAEFSKANDLGLTDIRDIATHIARWPKDNGAKKRMVVFTQGALPTLVVHGNMVQEFPVIPIEEKDIVDTNGAGDAFVGGFLAQLVQGRSLESSIHSGNYAANYIIQQLGVQIKGKPTLTL